jgi:twitching motility protein PilT
LNKDTLSYSNALKSALREDPDVIVIGELRDLSTISMSISAAETGHLVIGTLATSSGPKTIDRIIDAYPASQQNQIRSMLSEALRAVVTQRLIKSKQGRHMELATEVLIGTLPLANLIRDGKTFQINSMMQTGRGVGMQLMDDSIDALLKGGKISAQAAYDYANDPRRFESALEKETS